MVVVLSAEDVVMNVIKLTATPFTRRQFERNDRREQIPTGRRERGNNGSVAEIAELR